MRIGENARIFFSEREKSIPAMRVTTLVNKLIGLQGLWVRGFHFQADKARVVVDVVPRILAPHLTEDNIEMLISDCAGMRRRETEEYLVALKPKPVFEPSIRKRPVRAESSRPTSTPPPSPPSTPPPADPPKSSPPILQPATPELYNFRFSATRDFKDKFERLAEVVGVDNAQKNMAEILEKALDIALDKKDPKKKLERRRKRQEAASEPSRSERDGEKDERAESRYVASEVSERVHERDGYQCLYFAPDGTRCTSRVGLHLDHRSPFGIFHNNGEQVLRLLCPAHNLLMAERVYGVDFLQQKISERRKSRSP